MNRNKRAVVLDLRQEAAQEIFARLAATTDVLITNVREPALSSLGLAYEQVRAHRPDIIWVGVTAFGPDGPYAGRPGIDFLAQGYAGLLAINGRPGDEPLLKRAAFDEHASRGHRAEHHGVVAQGGKPYAAAACPGGTSICWWIWSPERACSTWAASTTSSRSCSADVWT